MIRAPDGREYKDEVALLLGEPLKNNYNMLLHVALTSEKPMPLHLAIKWAERKRHFAGHSDDPSL